MSAMWDCIYSTQCIACLLRSWLTHKSAPDDSGSSRRNSHTNPAASGPWQWCIIRAASRYECMYLCRCMHTAHTACVLICITLRWSALETILIIATDSELYITSCSYTICHCIPSNISSNFLIISIWFTTRYKSSHVIGIYGCVSFKSSLRDDRQMSAYSELLARLDLSKIRFNFM